MYKIRKYLKSSKNVIELDVKAFSQFNSGKISADECLEKFIWNNDIKNPNFTKDEFISWLKTLGYKKVEVR